MCRCHGDSRMSRNRRRLTEIARSSLGFKTLLLGLELPFAAVIQALGAGSDVQFLRTQSELAPERATDQIYRSAVEIPSSGRDEWQVKLLHGCLN